MGVAYPTLLSKIPMILKIAYDEDILDEDAILAWGKKPSKKYVPKDVSKEIRKKAQPFLDWLENADEESEDDESD